VNVSGETRPWATVTFIELGVARGKRLEIKKKLLTRKEEGHPGGQGRDTVWMDGSAPVPRGEGRKIRRGGGGVEKGMEHLPKGEDARQQPHLVAKERQDGPGPRKKRSGAKGKARSPAIKCDEEFAPRGNKRDGSWLVALVMKVPVVYGQGGRGAEK